MVEGVTLAPRWSSGGRGLRLDLSVGEEQMVLD